MWWRQLVQRGVLAQDRGSSLPVKERELFPVHGNSDAGAAAHEQALERRPGDVCHEAHLPSAHGITR